MKSHQNQQTRRVTFSLGGRNYQFELDGSPCAEAFAAALPVTCAFEDLGRQERYGYMPKLSGRFSTSESRLHRGCVGYYAPWGTLVFYLIDLARPAGVIPIGHAGDDVLEAIRKSGSEEIRFELAE